MDKAEDLDRWKQYFNEHLNREVAHGDDEQFTAPDLATVRKEIRQLKNNRAAGKDRLPGKPYNMEERHWLERFT